ncbi:MAG: dihydroorotate dehydrogenase [Thermoplasmata archaeon]|nr:MAG: dihydroorotate dehydrogenase [Thermoplasmata archaeon]
MLEIEIAKIKMKNPLMLASGILDLTRESMESFSHAGAIVTKSVGREERKGYKNPSIYELPYGLLNAIGLANPGIDEYIKEIDGIKVDVLIGSIFGENGEEFGYVARKMAPYVKAIEMNMSCPHAKKLGAEYPTDEIKEAVEEVKKSGKPTFVKLGMENLMERASQAVDAKADAIVAINTVRAMAIDIDARMPVLANKIGGYSGMAIKPIGVRCVYELASEYDLPIIGVGGITNAEDAIEYMMAGATAVQIGTGIYYEGKEIFQKILRDMQKWLDENGYNSIKDIIGIALKR